MYLMMESCYSAFGNGAITDSGLWKEIYSARSHIIDLGLLLL